MLGFIYFYFIYYFYTWEALFARLLDAAPKVHPVALPPHAGHQRLARQDRAGEADFQCPDVVGLPGAKGVYDGLHCKTHGTEPVQDWLGETPHSGKRGVNVQGVEVPW